MDNNMDFKKLWDMQPTSSPNPTELYSKLATLKKAGVRKIIFTNILLVATSAFIIFIWIYFKPQLLTTKIGIVTIILAMVVYVFYYSQAIPLLNKMDASESNKTYLKNLFAIKTQQQFLQTTMLNLYFLMLTAGLCLYLFEYTMRMTFFWGIFSNFCLHFLQ